MAMDEDESIRSWGCGRDCIVSGVARLAARKPAIGFGPSGSVMVNGEAAQFGGSQMAGAGARSRAER